MPRAGRGVALANSGADAGRGRTAVPAGIVYDVPLGEPTAEGYHRGKRATGRESAARSVGVMLAGMKDACAAPLVTARVTAPPCSLSAALATYWVIRVQRFLGFKARKAANLSSLPLTIRLYFA